MSSLQISHLTEQIAALTHDLEVTQQQLAHVRDGARCTRYNPDLPLHPHGPSRICLHCFEQLRIEHARAAVVVGSIRLVVHENMQRGQPCPFCNETKKHSDACYLDKDSGAKLVDEYRAIEQHRDMLLAERSRVNGSSAPQPNPTRVRLKSRFHRDRPNG